MSDSRPGLRARFREEVLGVGARVGQGPLVVAVSGGLDSTVLLHLLRFSEGLPPLELHVAHLDHAMRPGSAADAKWVGGLAAAWGLPFHPARTEGLKGEDAARNARLAHLESVRRSVAATWVALGHHADDQAETVLHRLVRGAGFSGLSGMPAFREPGLWRPLLPFWREELVEYARAVGLSWRTDPTNRDPGFARNALRHEVIPSLEARVAPGARRALVRLAGVASQEGAAWDAALAVLESRLDVRRAAGAVSLDGEALAGFPRELRGRVLRRLAGELGRPLDSTGTRVAAAFTSRGESGRSVSVTGGLVLRRDLDRVVLAPSEAVPEDLPLVIAGPGEGQGTARMGGRTVTIQWGAAAEAAPVHVSVWRARFPLTIRGRRPGDRIELEYGTKKVKKLLLEARVPEPKRATLPVLVDADDRVLWVPGVARAVTSRPDAESAGDFHIGIADADNH